MKPRYQVSDAGVALIKRFEGYRRHAARLDDGRWTIGYSHTRSARQGAEVSETDAEALLRYDLIGVVETLNELVYTPLTQNQFDALTSFVFNIGLANFRHASVLRRLNEGALLEAAGAIEMWRGADFEGERIVVDALVRRRAAEKALFLTPPGGFVPTPTPMVEPKLDFGGAARGPSAPPTTLSADLDGETATAARVHPVAEAAEDEPLSPAEAAAEAVAARLDALISDLDERPLTGPAEFPASPRPFGALGDQPPVSFDPAVRPGPASDRPEAAASPRPGPVGWTIFDSPNVAPVGLGLAPLAILGGLGLGVFTGAVFWMFNAKPAGGLIGPMGLGAVIAVVGVLCVVSAIYFLLERLAGRED